MLKKCLYVLVSWAGAIAISASAQSTLSAPVTLNGGSGFLMMTWDPVNGYQFRTTGETDVVYFSAPSFDPEEEMSEPGQVASWGGSPNGITSGEVTAGTVLGDSSLFSNYKSFIPQNNESGSYFGMDYDAGDGNFYYGWVEFSTTSSSLTLDAAYMGLTPNQAVTVGQVAPVPEPGTWALLGGGLAVLGVIRRRKH